MSNIEKNYAAWREKAPTEARFEEVYAVAEYYLGTDNIKSARSGSHALIIGGPIVRQAIEFAKRGYGDLSWVTDPISIPKFKGKTVKEKYIQRLVKIIEFKQAADSHAR